MLNLVQHLTESKTYETLKQVQGDKSGLFTRPSIIRFFASLRMTRGTFRELRPGLLVEKVSGNKRGEPMEPAHFVSLVTGASRGIGRAIAIGLAKEGVSVAVNYQSRRDAAEEVVREITGAGGKAIVVKADVANDAEVKSMVDQVVGKWGTIDILVNNAATHRGGRLQNLTLGDWGLVINSVLGGAFHCCRHILPMMVEKKWGRVINLSSYVGLHGYPGDTPYGAAKAGILGLTMSLAKEVSTKGITVNAIVPGFVPTDMTAGLFNTKEKLDLEIQKIPLRRPGKPGEIADMVNFLVFKGEYITGTVIRVDGGLAM
jgi:3-oxoacyl-[acyl-carrier protein] reductase